MLNILNTRTTSYHPQCDGQVQRTNRTIIEQLALNTLNPTENWNLDLSFILMGYRSAVQSSTSYTPYVLLHGREMRLPLDIIYRPPDLEYSRIQYAKEVRHTFERAYSTAREKLHLAHERQKDYYERRTEGTRFKTGDSKWLWSPVLQKGVAPKFHEPWTGLFKVTKRMSDVTYKIADLTNKPTKIVNFDRLNNASLKPRNQALS